VVEVVEVEVEAERFEDRSAWFGSPLGLLLLLPLLLVLSCAASTAHR
jgi:hypothetical protein